MEKISLPLDLGKERFHAVALEQTSQARLAGAVAP
jgi:hypothetical protein